MGFLPAGKHQLGQYDLASLPLVYLSAVTRSGGVPVAIPNDPAAIGSILPIVDGLLFMGGEDLDPKYYTADKPNAHNQKFSVGRDETELRLMKMALRRRLPILGICRGTQVLNVTQGGSLHQHLLDGVTEFEHCQTFSPTPDQPIWHDIAIEPNSRLHEVAKKRNWTVNSDHHQGVDRVGRGLIATAHAPDGVVECIESTKHPFVMGVQWHPERIYTTNPEQLKLFKRLIKEAKSFSAAGQSPPVTG